MATDNEPTGPFNEHKLDVGEAGGSRSAWMDAIAELESSAPDKTTTKKPAAVPSERRATELELLNQATQEIKAAQQTLLDFVKDHPYLIAPNIYRMWEDNIQESSILIEREREKHAKAGNP